MGTLRVDLGFGIRELGLGICRCDSSLLTFAFSGIYSASAGIFFRNITDVLI